MNAALAPLAGGVAVITGSGSGIGEGLARLAAQAGMKVVLADIAADRIAAVAASIQGAGGIALAVPTDVADAVAVEHLARRTHDAFGDVRLLVNNAGIETLGNSWEIPAATWQKAVNINIMGVIHGVRAFVPRMLAVGRQAYVANLSSVGGLGIMPGQAPYIMSKHSVLSFTECLSIELELTGKPVSVSAVLPGPVATRIFDDAPAGEEAGSVDHHRAYMQRMLSEHGMTSVEASRAILSGIVAGHFWVSTHPEMTASAARARADYLVAQQRPELSLAGRAILGLN